MVKAETVTHTGVYFMVTVDTIMPLMHTVIFTVVKLNSSKELSLLTLTVAQLDTYCD